MGEKRGDGGGGGRSVSPTVALFFFISPIFKQMSYWDRWLLLSALTEVSLLFVLEFGIS